MTRSPMLIVAFVALCCSVARGDQGAFRNSGGTTDVASGVSITSPVSTPTGLLAITCPSTSSGACSGGSANFQSADGSTVLTATFSNGSLVKSCSGGGRGGNVTCSWSFTGYFDGTLLAGGNTQAVTGVTSQVFDTSGGGATGNLVYNSTYLPFYFSDGVQILRSDDLKGSNLISYGSQGSGVGQFSGANGLAVDTLGRIYVADTYNCRIVRIDNMNGDNWTSFGNVCGSGPGQFSAPSGIAVDASGRLFVMDSGNSRVVQIDDISGTNWASYGAVGSQPGQFAPYTTSIAVDSTSRIYVADTGNKRIVRVDDISGANWVALTVSTPSYGGSIYSLQSPAAVAVDASGTIYIADNEPVSPAIVRVDDITGANWTSIYLGSGTGANSVSVDAFGTVFTEDGGIRFVDGMAGVLAAPSTNTILTSYYIFGVTPVTAFVPGGVQPPPTVPPPPVSPAVVSVSPSTLDFSIAGAPSPQTVTLTNNGGTTLNVFGVGITGPFTNVNSCPPALAAGTSCTILVSLATSSAPSANGLLTIQDDSTNMGPSQTVTLLAPQGVSSISVAPLSLTFSAGREKAAVPNQIVRLSNIGNTTISVTNIAVSGPFEATNQCESAVLPGGSCTITVALQSSVGENSAGVLTLTDTAGTQVVTLTANLGNQLLLDHDTLRFGRVVMGDASLPKNVTVFNDRSEPAYIAANVSSPDFVVVRNTCSPVLPPKSDCEVDISLMPSSPGSKLAALTFTDDSSKFNKTVTLKGAGQRPVTVSERLLELDTVAIGQKSSPKTLMITNHQVASLSIASIAIEGDFSFATNDCDDVIRTGASCAMDVIFVPMKPGVALGSITIPNAAGSVPIVVRLRGATTPEENDGSE